MADPKRAIQMRTKSGFQPLRLEYYNLNGNSEGWACYRALSEKRRCLVLRRACFPDRGLAHLIVGILSAAMRPSTVAITAVDQAIIKGPTSESKPRRERNL